MCLRELVQQKIFVLLLYVKTTQGSAEWRRTIEQWGCVYICLWCHIVEKCVCVCVCVCVSISYLPSPLPGLGYPVPGTKKNIFLSRYKKSWYSFS